MLWLTCLLACATQAWETYADPSLRTEPRPSTLTLSKEKKDAWRLFKFPADWISEKEGKSDVLTQKAAGWIRPLVLPASRAAPRSASGVDVVVSGDKRTLTPCSRQRGSVYCSFCSDVQNGAPQLTLKERFGLSEHLRVQGVAKAGHERLLFPCLRCPHGYFLTDYHQPNRQSLERVLKRGFRQGSNVTEVVFADSPPNGKCRRVSDLDVPQRQYVVHKPR